MTRVFNILIILICLSCICLLAMHTLICVTFSLPPGVGGWIRFQLVALPGLFCLPFCVSLSLIVRRRVISTLCLRLRCCFQNISKTFLCKKTSVEDFVLTFPVISYIKDDSVLFKSKPTVDFLVNGVKMQFIS